MNGRRTNGTKSNRLKFCKLNHGATALPGYVIYAMENAGFAHRDIQRVVDELHWVFDRKTIDEADEHYRNSSY